MTKETKLTQARRLPWIGEQYLKNCLLAAADKIENGASLLTGDAQGGARYIEREIVVETLRAVATDTPLGKVFRRGPEPTHHWDILRQVSLAQKGRDTLDAAIKEVAARSGKAFAATKKAYQRARSKEQRSYKKAFLEKRWPDWVFWDMTDEDIEQFLRENPYNFVDAEGRPVDMRANLRQRRDDEIAHILRLTGLKGLPER